MASRKDVPSCCCCLNVKHGSYFLASLVLVGGIFTVIAAAMLLSNPHSSEVYFKFDFQNLHYSRTAQWLSLGTGVCFVIIAAMAIFGLAVSKGTYLIPMFLMQIFGFICDMVYFGTVLVKWPQVKEYLQWCPHMPEAWKEWFQNIDDGWLIFIVIVVFVIDLSIKLFFISVVYRCYRHLLMQAIRTKQEDPEVTCVSSDEPVSHIYKLPKYNDIQKVPLVTDVEEIDTKPPPYSSQEKI